MKTILVATDYSEPAQNAVEYAAHLASKTGAELILFNVYKLSVHTSNSRVSSTSIDSLVKKNEKRLTERANEIADKYKIKVSWELRKDDTVENLKQYTSEHPVDMVIMGIESNRLEYKLFGNTTTAVLKLMQFPLLVVPHDAAFQDIHKIMYACDSSYLEDNCDLSVLRDFVKDFEAQLEVFHVLTDGSKKDKNEALEEQMNKILHDVNPTYRYVKNTRVGEGIKDGLEQSPSDLLVMVPQKAGMFKSLIKGSNTSQMTVKTHIPLLVIPSEKAC